MKTRWRLRESYFTVPGTYYIGTEKIAIEVDENRIFEIDQPRGMLVGVFAKAVPEFTSPSG